MLMAHKSLFISIEGINESETMAQLEMLSDFLRKNGYEFLSINFPKLSEPSSYFINQLNQNNFGKKEKVSPYVSSIFYALDRFASLKEINSALNNNQIVIVSNFTASTGAKEGSVFSDIGDFNDYLMWLKAVENRMFEIPSPDISIIIR
jgi:dTMP kinase